MTDISCGATCCKHNTATSVGIKDAYGTCKLQHIKLKVKEAEGEGVEGSVTDCVDFEWDHTKPYTNDKSEDF